MNLTDVTFIIQWWLLLLLIGTAFLPITVTLFSSFFDRGYIFAKILGIAILSYGVFLVGIVKIFPFNQTTIYGLLILFTLIIFFTTTYFRHIDSVKQHWKIYLFEEILFLAGIVFWSYIRSFQPDIHGLEKYMDYGFVNSILRSSYFPPADMWFTPFSINYYYFGHLVTAVLTKASMIPSNITYNLMLATIFAFTFTCSFSIGANLVNLLKSRQRTDPSRKTPTTTSQMVKTKDRREVVQVIFSGLLTAFLISFAGNLHTVYTFFRPYVNESPVPFWQLPLALEAFPNAYWYPNATRFIHNTIHEFPIYSFVVSDLHGHVLDIPFVLLTMAILLSLITKSQITNHKQTQNSNAQNVKRFEFRYWNLFGNWKLEIGNLLLISFLLAIMYMTNAWDGLIYFLLSIVVIMYLQKKQYFNILLCITFICIGSILFSLPFSLHFKPFVSGIGVLCAPEFLTKIEKIGPFLFEENHCQHSPIWQLVILHGFFYFWAISFIIFIFKKLDPKRYTLNASDIFVLILILLSTLLIIIPEFIYAKDIYPAHYRANTMFKLGYQAFIMLSICCGYIIPRLFLNLKQEFQNYWQVTHLPIYDKSHPSVENINIFAWFINIFLITVKKYNMLTIGYLLFAMLLLFLVFLYPYFAITSYYGNLKTYYSLDGTAYLKKLYPTDFDAISWINKNIQGQPILLEAQGDSYTDYARVSTNTGLPTILGWTVHEWLWRGTYDIPAPRITEIQTLYETQNMELARQLVKKYNISLIFIGDLERQKYPNLQEEKFQSLGKLLYENGGAKIYKLF